MTDQDRREWIAERISIVIEGEKCDYLTAMKLAGEQWEEYQRQQMELF